MRVEGPFSPQDPRAQAVAMASAVQDWPVRVPALGLWAVAAAERLGSTDAAARWALEYDPRMRLVSFEVWSDGHCVFGSDDLI